MLGLTASLAAQAPAAPASNQQQQTAPPLPAQEQDAPNPAATGQPTGGQSTDESNTPTFRITSNEVYLVFAVTDRHGHFIKDLKQSEFALLDDNKAPSQVYSFTQQTNLPLRVGILIDTSTSIRQRFQFEQQAATSFLLQIMRPASDGHSLRDSM